MPDQTEKHPRGKIKASKKQVWKRGYRSKGPSTSMKVRTNVVIQTIVLLAAAGLIANLAKIMLVEHDKYTDMANSRQFGTITIPAARGTIYDANEAVVAQSATVYKIFLDPGLFSKEMELVEKRNAELTEAAQKKQGDSGAKADVVDPAVIREQLVTYLAEILEEPESKINEAFDKDSNYVVLKNQVEKSRADRIIEYISDIRVPGSARKIAISSISRQSDTKRYYPQNELAASVIGFTNNDGHGFYGVEKYYDEYLSGVDGRNVTARDANGNDMPYRYSKTYPAQDGDDVYLTIDMTLQTYLESELTEMVNQFQVAERGCGVMLNAKTGAVLAMASVGGFDANEPYEIYDKSIASEIRKIRNDEEKTEALKAARERQWRNKCIAETYIPGSVFKVFTASAGLEENVIDYYNYSYTCTGSIIPYEGEPPIKCTGVHGAQSFELILKNSCNPAFISIGQTLGRTMFCQYFRSFGLEDRTGIDLPAETKSISNLDSMGPVDLAASSYGQRNSLTPIEMVTGYAAVVNGGYLLEPYVVSKVVDQAGNVVLSHDKTVRRQVISEETSAEMRRALQFVVDFNHGGNAYIKGYKIGGKSGTSQKLQGMINAADAEYVASYCCFAPADDPEIVLLIMADEPNKNITYYGATVVVPYSRRVLEKALPYLGIYPEYSAEEEAHKDVSVPLLIDTPTADAIEKLEDIGLNYEIVGDGSTVLTQMPITGTPVAKGGTVVLYTNKTTPEPVTVPSVINCTLAQANEILTEAKLNYVSKGSLHQDAIVLLQSQPAGSTVEPWSVITLDVGHDEDAG
ncbi:MAG: PASTA domain-containing protein [Oscillospiraceae bacterium]|nr:PASTA domain-containing protein [Oscillospiraceae bacterium]